MEQMPSTELFQLNLQQITRAHLREAARWARFLAIIGFVLCGLFILGGVFMGALMDNTMGVAGSAVFGTAMTLVYVIIAVIYFFPCLFLYRFANRMTHSLNGNSQEDLNDAFLNLKSFFRYLGIITIIVLALYALMVAVLILGYAAGS